MGGGRIVNVKYIEYVKKLQIESEEYKKNITKEELDIFNQTIDTYMLWSNIQVLYRNHRAPYSATIIFFTPPEKDEKNEKG